jgi:hypothetical protein
MKNIRYELQHMIKAVEPNIGTSLIKATQSFLSRNEKTSRPTNSNEYNKVNEERELISYIQKHNLFIDFPINENSFIATGAE